MAYGEIAVVAGMGITSALLSYMAFELRESKEEFWQTVSVGLFFMSIIFIDLLVFSLLLIIQNDSLTYLDESVVSIALTIILWTTTILVFAFFMWLIFNAIKTLIDMLSGKMKRDSELE
jgi:hypothetical protein